VFQRKLFRWMFGNRLPTKLCKRKGTWSPPSKWKFEILKAWNPWFLCTKQKNRDTARAVWVQYVERWCERIWELPYFLPHTKANKFSILILFLKRFVWCILARDQCRFLFLSIRHHERSPNKIQSLKPVSNHFCRVLFTRSRIFIPTTLCATPEEIWQRYLLLKLSKPSQCLSFILTSP
jgi:hypothetical protein